MNYLKRIRFIRKSNQGPIWLFRCRCGVEKELRLYAVKSNQIMSCGCLKREVDRQKCIKRNTTHNLSKHPLYNIWCGMKSRCYDINYHSYAEYGGRGILIGDEWLNSPEVFIKWGLENGWRKGLEIERLDNNFGYFMSNCVWVTRQRQNSNTRRTRYLTWNGKTQIHRVWENELKFSYGTISRRLKLKWSIEKIMTTGIS